MSRRKQSRKEKRSVSTASIQKEDSKNLQGGSSDLAKLIAWLEDFDMQCNLIVLIDYRLTLACLNSVMTLFSNAYNLFLC
jgi:hypothetical protein